MWLAKQDAEPVRITLQCKLADGKVETHRVDVTLQTCSSTPGRIRFPKNVTSEKSIDGQMVRTTTQSVAEADFAFSDSRRFELASLEIPVGHPVYDFRREAGQQGYWNGTAVEYGDPKSTTTDSPRRLRTHHFTLAIAGLCVVFAWILHRRKRIPK
jgi:hypothetical protein